MPTQTETMNLPPIQAKFTQAGFEAVKIPARLTPLPLQVPSNKTLTAAIVQEKQAAVNLKTGQSIEATVAGRGEDGRIQIKIGNRTIEVQLNNQLLKEALTQQTQQGTQTQQSQNNAAWTLRLGQTVILKLVQTSNPPVVEIKQPAAQSPQGRTEIIGQAVRNYAAIQRELPQLLSNLQQLAKVPELQNTAPQVAKEIQQVVQQLAQLKDVVKPEKLQVALRDAGNFLEAKLAQAIKHPGNLPLLQDFKAGLLRLQQIVSQWPAATTTATANLNAATKAFTAFTTANTTDNNPPTLPLKGAPLKAQAAVKADIQFLQLTQLKEDLLQQIESALARIRLNQAASAPDADQRLHWVIELPVRHQEKVHLIQLQIERENAGSHASQEQHEWTVRLAFNFEETGAFYAIVRIKHDEVSTNFWAEEKQTVKLIQTELENLERDLKESGLAVNHLAANLGAPPTHTPATAASKIIDEQA